jgi:hypothetical protein
MVLGHGILSALNKTIGFYQASRGTSLLVPVKAGINGSLQSYICLTICTTIKGAFRVFSEKVLKVVT